MKYLDKAKRFLFALIDEWLRVEGQRRGAALAFFSMLSMAPLLVVAVWVAGLALGEQAVRGELSTQISRLVGARGGEALESMIQASAIKNREGVLASMWGLGILVVGASGAVGELRRTLNVIWEAQMDNASFRTYAMGTGKAFALVLGAGFLLLVALLVSAGLSVVSRFFSGAIGENPVVLAWWNGATTLVVCTLLFALIMSGIPNTPIRFHEVLPGAFLTAVFFEFGKAGLGAYLGRAGFGSTYGAAGSLAAFLVWVYYASQIFYFGATMTKIWVRGLPQKYQETVDAEA